MSDTTEKTVRHHEVFGFYEGDQAAFLDHRSTARIAAACGAIQTLTAVLMQREVDADDMATVALRVDSLVAMGMLEAIACCTELVSMTASGFGPQTLGNKHFPSDSAGAELMRQTASKAELMRRATDGQVAA